MWKRFIIDKKISKPVMEIATDGLLSNCSKLYISDKNASADHVMETSEILLSMRASKLQTIERTHCDKPEMPLYTTDGPLLIFGNDEFPIKI